jgi:hypothetical protein
MTRWTSLNLHRRARNDRAGNTQAASAAGRASEGGGVVIAQFVLEGRRAWLALRGHLQRRRRDLRRVRDPRVVEGGKMASNLSEREILRRLRRLIELMAISEADVTWENQRRLFEFVGRDELLVGTLRRIETYAATAPDRCLADPPWRTQRLN